MGGDNSSRRRASLSAVASHARNRRRQVLVEAARWENADEIDVLQ
jgi:hypothetical protein